MKMGTLRQIIMLLCLSVYGYSQAQENQKLRIEVQVVDYMARQVKGAEVAVYEQCYDYSTGENYAKLLDEIKRTDADGR